MSAVLRPSMETAKVLTGALDSRPTGVVSRPKSAASDVSMKFESFVLQTFVQEMLPKNTDMTFGKGFAGEAWRSMFAEKLAQEISKGGGVGIAKVIEQSPQLKAMGLDAGKAGPAASVVTTLPTTRLEAGVDAAARTEWATEVTGLCALDAVSDLPKES